MIKKITLCALTLALSATFGLAQTTTTTPTTSDDYHKFEVFGGYSNNQVDSGISDDNEDIEDFFDDREGFNGFNVSAVGNFNRYIGAKVDVSGHYKNLSFSTPAIGTTSSREFDADASLYNILGGVQVKDNAKEGSRFRPFGHALIGVATSKVEVEDAFFSSTFCAQTGVVCPIEINDRETGFAAAIGGGIDIKATDRFSIRAIQVDYNPNRLGGSTQHNFRFGFGVVFH